MSKSSYYFRESCRMCDSKLLTKTISLTPTPPGNDFLTKAELGRDEAIKEYGMKAKWRIVPRDFGNYRDKKVFDVERVCIATNTMPYEDYL